MTNAVKHFPLKFEYEDVGFCRVVYSYTARRGAKYFYCVQQEAENLFVVYSCSSDHEPMSEIKFKEGVVVEFEESGSKDFDAFLKARGLLKAG